MIKLLLLLLLCIAAFLLFFEKTAPKPFSSPLPESYVATSPTPDSDSVPVVTQPLPDSLVTSPLIIEGTVPPGWMFEGVFPISLIDSDGNELGMASAHEKNPGEWQSGRPVAFSASISFVTKTTNGYILLKNDNPSGLPDNDKVFRLPVKLSVSQ